MPSCLRICLVHRNLCDNITDFEVYPFIKNTKNLNMVSWECNIIFTSNKKSHTCEEGGAHLRISFWHLLMNLKNK